MSDPDEFFPAVQAALSELDNESMMLATPGDSEEARIVSRHDFEIPGISEIFELRPTQKFYDANESTQAWYVLTGGLLFSSLLGVFLLAVTGQQALTQLIVAEKTLELERTNAALSQQIRNRERAEEDNAQLHSQLRHAQKMEALGQLAGGISHDFNNLLQVIHGYSEMALEELVAHGGDPDHMRQVLEASDRARQLVQQLLTFSRRDSLQLQSTDLNEIAGGMRKMLKGLMGEDVYLVFLPGANTPAVQAEPRQIEQVITNLCLNARDAMPDGGEIVIRTAAAFLDQEFSARHPWARAGQFAVLEIGDAGRGIAPEDFDHIFEPFYTTKKVGQGTGLGLAMVYGIVQKHEGLIDVESDVGGGTRFRIYLPASVDLAADAVDCSVEPGVSIDGYGTILLAEDEAQVRILAAHVLEEGWVYRDPGFRRRRGGVWRSKRIGTRSTWHSSTS